MKFSGCKFRPSGADIRKNLKQNIILGASRVIKKLFKLEHSKVTT